MVIVVGRVRCDAANRDALAAALEDPLSFIAVEEWADRRALDRHFAQPRQPAGEGA